MLLDNVMQKCKIRADKIAGMMWTLAVQVVWTDRPTTPFWPLYHSMGGHLCL
jgi:hypothetical protein